jgi:multidrug efflux pump subunit AcrA (membrane-fusion protein)
VKIAEIDLRMAEVEVQAAKRDYDRASKLKGAITETETDNLALAVKRAELHLERAVREMSSAERAAQNELEMAEAELAACRVLAPLDGIVVQVYARPGMWVKPGVKVCRVINLSKMCAEAYVDAMRFNPAELTDREVLISVRMSDGEVRQVNAKIVFASPEIEAGPRFRVVAEFPNEKRNGGWTARPGMIATMIIAK